MRDSTFTFSFKHGAEPCQPDLTVVIEDDSVADLCDTACPDCGQVWTPEETALILTVAGRRFEQACQDYQDYCASMMFVNPSYRDL